MHAQASRQPSSAPMRSAPMRSAPMRSAPAQAGPRVSPQISRPAYNQRSYGGNQPAQRSYGGNQPAQRSYGGNQPAYAQRSYGGNQPAFAGRGSGGRTVGNPVIIGHAAERPGYSGNYGGNYNGRNYGGNYGGGYRGNYGRNGFVERGGRFFPHYGWSGRAEFDEPFFRFRPWFTFGFGLNVGYPVAFPYGYYYAPYDYADGYPVYGMAEPVPVDPGYGAPPAPPDNTANFGGVTFDIQPTNAAVYVDGKYIGTVAEFSPQQPPLSLMLGRHHVDIRAEGFQTMSFDMDVVAGQVTPYQGAMTVIR